MRNYIRAKLFFLMAFVFLLYTCNRNAKVTESKSKTTLQSISNEDKKTHPKKSQDSLIIENKTSHIFSNPEKKDEFCVQIKGKSLLKGKVIFTITNSEGIEIYKEEFPSTYLIGYGLVGTNATTKDEEDFIKKRILEFFLNENFHTPAIKNEESYDEDYSNKEIWDEIKADQSAVGFYFLIGEEDGRRIAFSKKTKKVVLYFNCC